jgi:hypothetical protein
MYCEAQLGTVGVPFYAKLKGGGVFTLITLFMYRRPFRSTALLILLNVLKKYIMYL